MFTSGFYGMVFEHLQNCFHPKDSTNGFPQFFQLCYHIVKGHNPPRIAHVLGATYFLTMTKPSRGVCPIAMGETLYQLTNVAYVFNYAMPF
jgi:hypothetical protein